MRASDALGSMMGETQEMSEGAAGGPDVPCGHRHDDAECRERACRLFAEIVGEHLGALRWDETHHLQAHAHVGERDYVLIAARDDEHEPVLLDKDDWDLVSRASGEERAALLRTFAIRRDR